MLILGGTYGERCMEPERDEVSGSGLRAAAALAQLDPDVRLVTAIDKSTTRVGKMSEEKTAQFVADHHGLNVDFRTRSKPVSWSYFTPLSAPSLNGSGSVLLEAIDIEADAALVFGLVEVNRNESPRPKVRGRRVAVDPQKPRDLSLTDIPDINAEEVLLILNEDETMALGQGSNIAASARNLLNFQDWTVAAVITKRGPRGALVTTETGQPQVIPPLWTPRVYPIGSGDVFAAAAAWAWAEQGHTPVDAATIGSAAAAFWCDREDTPVTLAAVNDSPYTPVDVNPTARVYLAGPFFNLAQRWLIDLVDHKLRPYRFSPFHHVGPGGVDVAKKDLAGLDICKSMLALLDGSDPGTVFETGYATHLEMPVVCFAEHIDHEGYKMLAGTGAEITSDLSTAVYHSIWAAMDPAAWRARFT
jgi:ATP-dependent protease HslVU (ClpYQ) peptidase subunit